jgi:LPS sulfotransferase NodH
VTQFLTAQKVDVAKFLQRAAAAQWHILYMTRQDIVRQSISTILATRRRQWYSYDKPQNHAPQTIDPAELHQWLQRRVDHTAIEQAALRDLPHLPLVYERDLLDAVHHQATMDRVFTYIGVPTIPVVAQTQRMSDDLRATIANYDELIASLRGTPFIEYTDLC